MIATASYSSAAEMLASYRERRQRLMGWQPTPSAPVEPIIAPVVVTRVIERPEPAPMPLWKRGDVEFTAHIDAWHVELRERTSPVRYMKRRAAELGFTYQDMIGPYRGRAVVAARQLLIWEVKHNYPHVSFPQLGRMFGGRDHTTALHAVKKIEAQRVGQ